jgi:hypothetical protein
MNKLFLFSFAYLIILFGSFSTDAQTTQQSPKDSCERTEVLLTSSKPLAFSLSNIYKLPQCFNNKLVRIVGIYRIAFENSDLYDPTGSGSSWLTSQKFYPIIERCSSPEALKSLDRKNGGTFGIVAMGIFNTGDGYGHLGGWNSEFQMICLEEVKDFSKSGSMIQYQTPEVKKQITDWYAEKAQIK